MSSDPESSSAGESAIISLAGTPERDAGLECSRLGLATPVPFASPTAMTPGWTPPRMTPGPTGYHDWPLSREEKKQRVIRLASMEYEGAEELLRRGEAELAFLREQLRCSREKPVIDERSEPRTSGALLSTCGSIVSSHGPRHSTSTSSTRGASVDCSGDLPQEEPLSTEYAMERLRHVVANLDQAVHVLNTVMKTADVGKLQAASDKIASTAAPLPQGSAQGRRSRREPGPEPEASECAPRDDCKKRVEETTEAQKRFLADKDHGVYGPREACKKNVNEPHTGLNARAARRALLEQRRRSTDARHEATVRRTTLHDALEKDDVVDASVSDDNAWSSVATYFGVGGQTQRIQSGVQVTHKEGRGCMIYCW